eukprot:TRINITY_DN12400_c0_g1_i1.p1 TRINITY_DN12400_c0_g1~~TRINITY_DN12400_c0_g1_i1.p1  ORF type:complete len:276 (-),score=36.93 TRINITY_DN12400_c0_g1_i1:102-929(-)
MSIDTQEFAKYEMGGEKFYTQITGLATKFPSFYFTGYQSAAYYQEMITSTKQLSELYFLYRNKTLVTDQQRLEADRYDSLLPINLTYNIPKEQLYIKFERKLNQTERNTLANGIKQFFTNESSIIWDTASFEETSQQVNEYLQYFFFFVALLTILLTFFLLYVSFIQNINEQYCEIGILRAIGLTKKMIEQIYIIEALSLILTSGIFGTIIGISLSYLIVIQSSLFTELPPKYEFPYYFVSFLLVSGVLNAILSPKYSLTEILSKKISEILRGLK